MTTSDPEVVRRAERIVLPGVGHFGRAMANLRAAGMIDSLEEAVVRRGVPVLGICLGMQLLAHHSEEGDVAGLGWIDASVVRFRLPDEFGLKVPHMGWNGVRIAKPDPLVASLGPDSEFYFVHAFHLACRDRDAVLGETEYGHLFPSIVGRGRIYGVQFHPEKSHGNGDGLLRSFAAC